MDLADRGLVCCKPRWAKALITPNVTLWHQGLENAAAFSFSVKDPSQIPLTTATHAIKYDIYYYILKSDYKIMWEFSIRIFAASAGASF